MATALVVGAAVTGVVGASKQKKAGKEAQGLANQNASNIRTETVEEKRRLQENQRQVTEMTKAQMGSSGVKSASGSQNVYLEEMQKAFSDDLAWLEKSGESNAQSVERGGSVANKQAQASSWGTISSSMQGMVGYWA